MKAYVYIATNYGNAGDLFINASLISMIAEECDVVVNVGGVPNDFAASLISLFSCDSGASVSFVTQRSLIDVFRIAFNSEVSCLFLSPGAYPGRNNLGSLTRKTARSAIIRIWRLFGKRVYWVGGSIPGNPVSMHMIDRFFLKSFNFVGIRSSRSVAASLKSMKNFGYFPDLAICRHSGISLSKPMIYDRTEIGISFRQIMPGEEASIDRRLLIENIISILKGHQLFQGSALTCLSQVRDDADFMKNVSHDLINCEHIPVDYVDYGFDLNRLDFFYKKCRLVITNRLHVGLLALNNGAIPFLIVNLKRDKKIVDIFDDLNLESLLVPEQSPGTYFHKLDIDSIIEQINSANKKIKDLSAEQKVCIKKLLMH